MTTTATPPFEHCVDSAGAGVVAALEAVREVLLGVARGLVGVASSELAEIGAAAAAVVASAEAMRAAVVLEASERGVIAESDHPRPHRWVEQSCREAGVPVSRRQARELGDVTATCRGYDVAALREAVTAGRLPVETAATVAKTYRRLKQSIEYPNWDALLDILIDWAASGASPKDLATLEEGVIGRYGPEGELDEKHEHAYLARELTGFRRDRLGRLVATLRLDPASEATFTAALHAISAPHLDDDGHVDPRTPGQRRADALITMATTATTPVKGVRGSGAKARVVVTMSLDELRSGLTASGRETGRAGTVFGGGAGAFGGAGAGGDGVGGFAGDGDARGVACGHDCAGASGVACRAAGRCVHDCDHTPQCGERGYGVTGFEQVLSPTEARVLACDAQIIPAVLGTRGELLDLGRAKRLVTPGLTAALHLRDQGCSFPGCTAPPSWCDGHHIVHWAKGGPTDLDNLALLCRHHHTEVHRRGHVAAVDCRSGVHWTRSDGTPIGNTARPAA